jgi:hypothetical protein
MYHLELRKFPHVVSRFNRSEAQLRAIVLPWVRQEWIEEGERKWNANEATLTVLEGPKLSMPELAMGKGWRNAQRRSQDVTERVLAAARSAVAAQIPQAAQPVQPAPAVDIGGSGESGGGDAKEGGGGRDLLADSLALELLALLDDGALPPARVWELARIRLDRASAADSLALAERAVRALLGRGLIVLVSQQAGVAHGSMLDESAADAALGASDTWASGPDDHTLLIARKV